MPDRRCRELPEASLTRLRHPLPEERGKAVRALRSAETPRAIVPQLSFSPPGEGGAQRRMRDGLARRESAPCSSTGSIWWMDKAPSTLRIEALQAKASLTMRSTAQVVVL